ncbi:MAG: hypothetical protein PVF65_08665 [Sphingomonadales bacterium]|jgi:hypothetical protein
MITKTKTRALALLGASILGAWGTSAQAQQDNILAPFEGCAVIEDALVRVECFDKALVNARKIANAEARLEPETKPQTPTQAKPQVNSSSSARSNKQDDFGKSAVVRNQERREQGLEAAEPEKLTSKIASFKYDLYGKLTVTLENGQVWQSTEKSRIKRVPGQGAVAEIQKSSFGGYRLRIDGARGRTVVKRIK